MLDLTPLDLEEVENYIFETKRVVLEDLQSDLQYRIQDVIEDRVGAANSVVQFSQDRKCNYALVEKEVQEALDSFNQHSLSSYTRGIIATAKAGCRLIKHNNPPGYIAYEAWVDYCGITQAQCDRLPAYLSRQIYEKYLQGFKVVRSQLENDVKLAQKEIEACIMDVFHKYIGRPLTLPMLNTFSQDIVSNLKNTGLADEVELDYSNPRQIVIKSTIHGVKGNLCINTTLSIN